MPGGARVPGRWWEPLDSGSLTPSGKEDPSPSTPLPPSFFLLLDPRSEGGGSHCYGKSGKGREFTGRSHQRPQAPPLHYLRQTREGLAHGWAGSRLNPRALGPHHPAMCIQSRDCAAHHSNRRTWGLTSVCAYSVVSDCLRCHGL